MKYKTIIETDEYKDFEFYEDGIGKFMVGKDAGATADGGWMPLYFTKCEQESCEDEECACLTKDYFPIRYEKIGYGKVLSVGISFNKHEIYTDYYYHCDQNKRESVGIKYCPFCGRKLNITESEV